MWNLKLESWKLSIEDNILEKLTQMRTLANPVFKCVVHDGEKLVKTVQNSHQTVRFVN